VPGLVVPAKLDGVEEKVTGWNNVCVVVDWYEVCVLDCVEVDV
jgi:hypothetical protein